MLPAIRQIRKKLLHRIAQKSHIKQIACCQGGRELTNEVGSDGRHGGIGDMLAQLRWGIKVKSIVNIQTQKTLTETVFKQPVKRHSSAFGNMNVRQNGPRERLRL